MDIIRQAVEEILKVYARLESDWEVRLKDDRTPVTEADRVSNAIITESLKKLFPGIPIISEESLQVPYEVRKRYEYLWLLDPLDGTKEFLQRNGEFTVNLAFINRNKPVAGFISVPCKGLFYYAIKGEGAYKIEGGDRREDRKKVKLRVAEFSMDEPGLAVVASRSHFDEETKKFIEGLNHPRLTNRGSSLKFMLLAEGKAHLYPRMGKTMEWDTAAGQAILEEAGGSVLDFSTRIPLGYNKESLINPAFLATGKLTEKKFY